MTKCLVRVKFAISNLLALSVRGKFKKKGDQRDTNHVAALKCVSSMDRNLRMDHFFCDDTPAYWQDGVHIYPTHVVQREPVEWQRQPMFQVHQGSVSIAELSQNDTEPSINTSALNLGHLPFTSSALAGFVPDAQFQWESSCSGSREPWSNCSSICSSASTLASAASCAFPPLSYAPAYAPAPSFDFTRPRTQTHAHEYIDTQAAHRPCELGSLSVGPGVAATPPMAWQWASALQAASAAREAGAMDGIEEFSLGPCCPR